MQVDGATVVVHNCAGGGEAWEGSGGWRRWRLLSSARGVVTSGASSATSWVGTSSSVDGVAAIVFDVVAMGILKASRLVLFLWACHFGISCFYRCGSTAVSYGGEVVISCFYRDGSTADSRWESGGGNQLLLPKWEHSRFEVGFECSGGTIYAITEIVGEERRGAKKSRAGHETRLRSKRTSRKFEF